MKLPQSFAKVESESRWGNRSWTNAITLLLHGADHLVHAYNVSLVAAYCGHWNYTYTELMYRQKMLYSLYRSQIVFIGKYSGFNSWFGLWYGVVFSFSMQYSKLWMEKVRQFIGKKGKFEILSIRNRNANCGTLNSISVDFIDQRSIHIAMILHFTCCQINW